MYKKVDQIDVNKDLIRQIRKTVVSKHNILIKRNQQVYRLKLWAEHFVLELEFHVVRQQYVTIKFNRRRVGGDKLRTVKAFSFDLKKECKMTKGFHDILINKLHKYVLENV